MNYRFFHIIILLLLSLGNVFSQPGNLVPNPGFEERIDCIYNDSYVEDAPPWFAPSGGTSDLFHECAINNTDPCPYPDQLFLDPWLFGIPTNGFGCQSPRTGDGYAGAFLFNKGTAPEYEWKEYLAVPLNEPLETGTEYFVRYYVSLAERMTHAIWAFQVAFTDEMLPLTNDFTALDLNPQLTSTEGDYITSKSAWTEISYSYIAQGGESYMYIGNFEHNPVIDTFYVLGDTIQDIYYYGQSAYYYIDDVYVGTDLVSVNEKDELTFLLFPNPVMDKIHLRHSNDLAISIYNINGKELFRANYFMNEDFKLDVSKWSSGMYFITAEDNAGNRFSKKWIKR